MNKIIINGNFSGIHGVALLSTFSRSNWDFEMLVFVEGGKQEYLEKNPRSRDENQQLITIIITIIAVINNYNYLVIIIYYDMK